MVNITYMDTANSLLDVIEGVNVSLNHGLGLIILGVLALLIFIVFQGYLIKQILLIDAFFYRLHTLLKSQDINLIQQITNLLKYIRRGVIL